MPRKNSTLITIILAVVLAIALIAWTIWDLDFSEIWQQLSRANPWLVAASFFMGLFGYFLRSERWKLLQKPIGYQVSSINTFIAVCMNYFWNLIIPRSGEVARCTTLYATEKVPVNKALGTVISERLLDMICLGIFGILALILQFGAFVKFFEDTIGTYDLATITIYLSILGILGIGTFIALWYVRHKIQKLKYFNWFKNLLMGIINGMQSILVMKDRGLFILYTIGIWVVYFLMTYILVFALPETSHINLSQGLFLFLVGGLGMVVPASGGIGSFHAAMRLGFVILGMSPELGVTFGFLVHTPHMFLSLISGLFAMGYLAMQRKGTSTPQ
ncbi:MAG: lysylphosphatidylglycerol synthase transmembrane domain-containing protein [Weeksellaceae bacterium]|nr:lysylphosphatidylglycerol synthase transmembrane domain-containing protein [Weeksellaceae bacterium]